MNRFTRRTALIAGLASAAALPLNPFAAGAAPRGGSRARAHALQGTPAAGNHAPVTGIERDQLLIATYTMPSGLDPSVQNSNISFSTIHNAFDTLITRDFRNGNAITPMLATSWEALSETEYEFVLRENVVFHDGSIMTADDVVASFERVLNAEEGSSLLSLRAWIQTIASVEAIDDLRVKFTTEAPDPVFLRRLTLSPCYVVPRAYAKAFQEDDGSVIPPGTGPFRITSFTPDTEMVLERHEEHWGGPSPAKRIVYTVVPEQAARTTSLLNREVDLITNVTPDQIESIASSDQSVIREALLSNVHMLVYNTHQPGLQDKRLRQALNLAIDRALITEALWLGHAHHLRGLQLESFGELYNADRPLTPYDPDRARQLVEESDYSGETIYYQNLAGYYINSDQTAPIIAQMWQDIGVNVEVQLLESSAVGEDRFVHTWSNSDLWSDPASLPYRLWGAGSTIQNLYWDAPQEFNDLGESAQRTLDQAERYASYQRMLDIFEDEAPGTDLHQPADIFGVQASINWEPSPMHHMDFRPFNLSFNE